MGQSRQEENKYSPAANVTNSLHLDWDLHDICKCIPVAIATTVTRVEEDLLANQNTIDT